jgi:hypothetical protein
MKKVTFKKFLFELETPAPAQVQTEFKADIVDLLRSHTKGGKTEVMYNGLRAGKEKESFLMNFNRLDQKYSVDAIKDSRFFRNTFTIYFHAPKLKPGFFLEVNARFTDPTVAKEIYEELLTKYRKKI